MNKSTLWIALGFWLAASTVQGTTPLNGSLNSHKTVSVNKSIPRASHSQSLSPTSRWYDYWEMAQTFSGGAGTTALTYLFPDSSILAPFGASYESPWVHKVATILDPLSGRLNDAGYFPGELNISPTTSFTVDSIEYRFAYQRVNANSVDTLIFEVGINATMAQSNNYYFAGTSNYGPAVDTAFFRAITYTYTTNSVGSYGTKKTYKVVLDEAFASDTVAGGFNVARIACTDLPASIAGNRFPMCAVTFKPGYSWSVGPSNEPVDTLTSHNYILITALQENGTSTFPTYRERDYNMGYILPTNVRYNLAPNWNGLFIPSIAYTAPFAFEIHPFRWKLSIPSPVGMKSSGSMEGPVVFPNPNTGAFFVENNNYQTIRVLDAMGKTVWEQMPAGQTRVAVDVQGLNKGMYFIQGLGQNGISTTKMIKD